MFRFLVIVSLATLALAVGRPYGRSSYGLGAPSYSRGSLYGSAPHSSYSAPAPIYGGGGYGHDYAQPTPFDFGYEIAGDHGEFKQNRQESGDGHGNVKGSYGYTDAHGIYRQVDYTADGYGFRAQVKTNEPGTDNQNPADVHISAQPAQYHQPAAYGGGYGHGAPRYGRY